MWQSELSNSYETVVAKLLILSPWYMTSFMEDSRWRFFALPLQRDRWWFSDIPAKIRPWPRLRPPTPPSSSRNPNATISPTMIDLIDCSKKLDRFTKKNCDNYLSFWYFLPWWVKIVNLFVLANELEINFHVGVFTDKQNLK